MGGIYIYLPFFIYIIICSNRYYLSDFDFLIAGHKELHDAPSEEI